MTWGNFPSHSGRQHSLTEPPTSELFQLRWSGTARNKTRVWLRGAVQWKGTFFCVLLRAFGYATGVMRRLWSSPGWGEPPLADVCGSRLRAALGFCRNHNLMISEPHLPADQLRLASSVHFLKELHAFGQGMPPTAPGWAYALLCLGPEWHLSLCLQIRRLICIPECWSHLRFSSSLPAHGRLRSELQFVGCPFAQAPAKRGSDPPWSRGALPGARPPANSRGRRERDSLACIIHASASLSIFNVRRGAAPPARYF